MIYLETDRLALRNYTMEDMEDLMEIFSQEEVAQYEDFDPMTKDEVNELIVDWIHKDHRMVVIQKNSNKVIGCVGYWVDEDGDYSIDYDFNPRYSKLGFATEAANKLLTYLFEELKILKIYGDCDIRNENSWHLLERLGFQRIQQLDNESYKEDDKGNPILISIYLYLKYNEIKN